MNHYYIDDGGNLCREDDIAAWCQWIRQVVSDVQDELMPDGVYDANAIREYLDDEWKPYGVWAGEDYPTDWGDELWHEYAFSILIECKRLHDQDN
jgi:hypothetical protein